MRKGTPSRTCRRVALALAALVSTAALAARYWSSGELGAAEGDLTPGEDPPRRYAVTTSLWRDDDKYVRYVLVLGHSLKLSNGAFLTSADVDMVMLTYADSGLSAATQRDLGSVGWQIKEVTRLPPPVTEPAMGMDNFGRLHLWDWTEYWRVVYIDADCLVMGDISGLFQLPAGITAAVGDAWPGGLDSDHFNAGVLSLEPAAEDYANLLTGYQNHTTYMDQGAMEQGLLNWYFKHNITALPRIYNFNLVMASKHKEVWDEAKGGARVVHYTTYKPGASREEDMLAVVDHEYKDSWGVTAELQEPLMWWWDVYDSMMSSLGAEGTGQPQPST